MLKLIFLIDLKIILKMKNNYFLKNKVVNNKLRIFNFKIEEKKIKMEVFII
jgi:poly(3-hydroxyalkanoate) synthetase